MMASSSKERPVGVLNEKIAFQSIGNALPEVVGPSKSINYAIKFCRQK